MTTIKKIILAVLSTLVVIGFALPGSVLARERQDSRDTGRNIQEEVDETPSNDEQNEVGGGGAVYVKNSIIISSRSGNQEENGEDGITTGDESSSATVETIVNGKTVQDIEINGEDVSESQSTRRGDRRNVRYVNDDGNVVVDTEIIIEDGNSESNDTGNQSNNGSDGEDGADGQDGSPAPNVDPVVEEDDDGEIAEEDGGDRRDRGDRSGRGGITMLWSRVGNFFNDVFSLFFA